ncbi:MAG TPA: RNA methyltransferase [Clostridiales bacterium]|nr:RNA methyltransferase [Clostridiales bacterium]
MKNQTGNKTAEKAEIITSPSNSNIKRIKSLMMKKFRDSEKLFIAEGRKMVAEALLSDYEVELLVFSESFSELLPIETEDRAVRRLVVKDSLFGSLSDTQTPQGILAVIKQKSFDLKEEIGKDRSFLVILDGVKDPGNLGTIIRTVDAAGGNGVVLINDCVDPYNPKAVRSTMGSIFRVPVYQADDTEGLLDDLSREGYHIAASHLDGSNVFTWAGGYSKTALVIGSESHGISLTVKQKAHSLIKIPMVGGAESLNASVAAGILIYEIFRKGIILDM